jgi:hypothetical protein
MVIGVRGSMRAGSASRGALQAALDGALDAGARRTLMWVRELRLHAYLPRLRQRLVQECAGLADPAGGPEAGVPGAWSVPLVLPVAESWRTFDSDGRLADEMAGTQMHHLGAEVVRAARQFQAGAPASTRTPASSPRPAGSTTSGPGRRPPDRGLRPSPWRAG